MIREFYLPFETPSKKNSRVYLRNGRNIPSKRYRLWHDQAMAYIMPQINKTAEIITDPVQINLVFTHGDYIRRDSDNQVSSILDLLQDAEVIIDDNWTIIKSIQVYNDYDKNNPSCKILITSI